MDKHYVTVAQYENETLGLIYINTQGSAMFAISTSENGLADAILENYWGYDNSLMEICLQEILELGLNDTSRDYQILTGSWAASAGNLILEVIENRSLPRILSYEVNLVEPTWAYWNDDGSMFCVLFSNEPKIMQLYSKQQAEIFLNSVFDLGIGLDNYEQIKQRVLDSELPDESESIPSVWEGLEAKFMIAAILLSRSEAKKNAPVVIVKDKPWKHNYQFN